MTGICFGAIADDLTGGVELASILVAAGVRTQFFIGPVGNSPEIEAEAVVVAVKSRVAPRDAALNLCTDAARFLASRHPRQMFFKYCSTFSSRSDGNIGPCVDHLMDLTGARQTIFCPAFPEINSTVYNGYAFSRGVLLSDSSKRFDPATPMTQSNLIEVLRPQTKRRVDGLFRRTLTEGPDACFAYLEQKRQEGVEYFIADAVCDEDLSRIAALSREWPLITGHSALLGHYPAHWRSMGWLDDAPVPESLPATRGPGAVLAGSCSVRNMEQLEHFKRQGAPALQIDLQQAAGGVDVVGEALAWAQDKIGDKPFAIATSAPPAVVRELQARVGKQEASRLADATLAGIAAGLIDRGVRRLLVSGGETSGAVVDALKIGELRIGPYVPGKIPLAIVTGAMPYAVCLKSGGLGTNDVFDEHLNAMAGIQ